MHFEKEEEIIEKIAELFKKDPTQINRCINQSNDTLLHYAVYHRKYLIAEFLVKEGIDVARRNSFGLCGKDLMNFEDLKTDFLAKKIYPML